MRVKTTEEPERVTLGQYHRLETLKLSVEMAKITPHMGIEGVLEIAGILFNFIDTGLIDRGDNG